MASKSCGACADWTGVATQGGNWRLDILLEVRVCATDALLNRGLVVMDCRVVSLALGLGRLLLPLVQAMQGER
jgi:hypothetical protein